MQTAADALARLHKLKRRIFLSREQKRMLERFLGDLSVDYSTL
jgi:hypothetical protein